MNYSLKINQIKIMYLQAIELEGNVNFFSHWITGLIQ